MFRKKGGSMMYGKSKEEVEYNEAWASQSARRVWRDRSRITPEGGT